MSDAEMAMNRQLLGLVDRTLAERDDEQEFAQDCH